MAFGFDADRLLVWLAPREPDGDPLRAGSLCKRHADAMVVPRGWTLDDRRENTPRLFRPVDPAPGQVVEGRRRARPRAASAGAGEQLDLGATADDGRPATVAVVTGEVSTDDPDATIAIPWRPEFDTDDDLDGVLDAGTPLLARAFRGTDRPR